MALKKSQLYSSLWKSCDQLRGGMDASQYKDYVLTLLFMKYVSDKYVAEPDPVMTVPEGGSFADMVACRGQKDIGDRVNKIIGRFAEANDLRGVIDQADFNDDSKLGRGEEMQDRLTKLVSIFDDLDFSTNQARGDDLLGDAYEYLMRHFATESGKAKGQFYTPAEVSRIMAQVIGIGPNTRSDHTIYDPTCGSGSLLLKAADQAPGELSIYGQEMDNATWGLARMNMILHGYPTAVLERGNVLADPQFTSGGALRRFDFAVANPPFSNKSWSNGLDPLNDTFRRFADGIPPDTNGDFAFLLHLLSSLKTRGTGAIILPHGVLFRGKQERHIRRNLIRRGLIKAVIGLPANLFYGTPIPACIIVVDKKCAHANRDIFMIDASKGFRRDGNKNRLRAQDIHRIVDVFRQRTETPGYSRMIPFADIADPSNDYNLNIPRYVIPTKSQDLHDLDAHVNGGVPDRDLDALDQYWAVLPSLRSTLFRPYHRQGYSRLRVAPDRIQFSATTELTSYKLRVMAVFNDWCDAHRSKLRRISATTKPGSLLVELAEDFLVRFAGVPLLNRYNIYQVLMDYWEEAMQDDVFLIASEGWVEAAQPRQAMSAPKETPDMTVKRQRWKMDLVPPTLVKTRFCAREEAALTVLAIGAKRAERELEDFLALHVVEGGVLEDIADDNGKVTKRQLTTGRQAQRDEALDVYRRCLCLFGIRDEARKAVKAAENKLDAQVLARYGVLSESAVKELVIEDKWFDQLKTRINDNTERALAFLFDRIDVLCERYGCPLPELEEAASDRRTCVMAHLAQLGVSHDRDSASPRNHMRTSTR